jgi:hypothetical protein
MNMAVMKIGDFVETPAPAPVRIGPVSEWVLITVRMNHEREAVDSLRRSGSRAYYPSYEELVPTKRQFNGQPVRRLMRRAIIPGHVFTPVVPGITLVLDLIIGAIGVVRTHAGDLLTIKDEDVQIIRAIEAGLNVPTTAAEHSFKVGEKVGFVDDLTGRWPHGKIVRIARKGRIGVEVALMGRKVTIYVLPHQIERT